MRGQRHDEGGITLLEITVVIFILGILSAIALPIYLDSRKAGYDSTMKTAVHNANIFKVGSYQAQHGGKAPVSLTVAGYSKPNENTNMAIVQNGYDYCLFGYVEGSEDFTSATPFITYNSDEVDACPIAGTPVYE